VPLPAGYLLAVDAAGLKALRALKSDPKRRELMKQQLATSAPPVALALGDCWQYLEHLSPSELLTSGKRLHKGQLCHLFLLDPVEVSAALAQLPLDEAATHRAFLAIEEKAFAYRFVPFWVSDEWKRKGVKTMLTQAQAVKVASALTALRGFIEHARSHSLQPLVFCDYHLS
jgi:hypothetical protein